ncbi:uncharacterized protein NESG_01556 [Nematocida ausubeli]|uniref:Uncharacterized protein n=1 Tax=Nematocida ausubeli (strain ATCC PRA-371 / ERTm2) TaxID=1913371 RepID=A0A086J2R5_NEMA1|nr:uncharacterized protein NESG_01556 [Nematocida ausubeli]KFG26433.1 hypothetical protein NESG_01556 [Nematocida ausubeli]
MTEKFAEGIVEQYSINIVLLSILCAGILYLYVESMLARKGRACSDIPTSIKAGAMNSMHSPESAGTDGKQ